MTMVQNFERTFESIANAVNDIAKTEKTVMINGADEVDVEIANYTDYGLSTLGKTLGFPAPFVQTVAATNPALAEDIIKDRAGLYFGNEGNPFYTREFNGQICGAVSQKYAIFDDNQVIEIMENSSLANLQFAGSLITPERLHLRAIDKEHPFYAPNDGSPLYFCYFVDNSMVGQSSFKIQFGIYRLACTNGMILPVTEFVVCKQVHRGNKGISVAFNEAIAELEAKRDTAIDLITSLAMNESKLETMQDELRPTYLARTLNLSQKEASRVMELYTDTYNGKTKWALVNAITEFARDINVIERREYLERKALIAA